MQPLTFYGLDEKKVYFCNFFEFEFEFSETVTKTKILFFHFLKKFLTINSQPENNFHF